MERPHILSLNEFYHLYTRGVDKRIIFNDESDRKRFESLLFLFNQNKSISFRDIKAEDFFVLEKRGEPIVSIGAWCLMPNHFHLLVKETVEGGISKFMGKVLTAYSMYFNKKYKRTGSLFESTFKSEHVDTDNYLKYISAYIHLNPLSIDFPEWKRGKVDQKEAVKFLDIYPHSSLLDYKEGNNRAEKNIITPGVFPQYHKAFKDMINDYVDWIEIKNEKFT